MEPVKTIRELVKAYPKEDRHSSGHIDLLKLERAFVRPNRATWRHLYEEFWYAMAMCEVDGAEDPFEMMYHNYISDSPGSAVAKAFIQLAKQLYPRLKDGAEGLVIPGLGADESMLLLELDINELVSYMAIEVTLPQTDMAGRSALWTTWRTNLGFEQHHWDEDMYRKNTQRLIQLMVMVCTIVKDLEMDLAAVVNLKLRNDWISIEYNRKIREEDERLGVWRR